MGQFISNFNTTAELEAFMQTDEFKTPHVSLTKDSGEVHYFEHDYSQDYFTMVVTSGGNITWSGSTADNTLSYSKDNGETWTTANSSTAISVVEGDKILWKGTPTPEFFEGIGTFSGDTNVRYSVEGNAMSLLYGDNFKGQTSLSGKDFALYGLFYDNTNVTSAENLSLPATTLATFCYGNMFQGCTSLTTAPELPATTLAQSCYQYMFRGCTNLTTAPELPATTLANNCYYSMFQGCTSLTTAPELPATTLANYCYQNMFYGCTSLNYIKAMFTTTPSSTYMSSWVSGVASSGTFVKNSTATWTSSCDTSTYPCNWTVETASS